MNRLLRFRQLAQHPWHGRNFKRLSSADRDFAEEWIKAREDLDHHAFEHAVNRMFLDVTDKPAKWSLILDLVANSNGGSQ